MQEYLPTDYLYADFKSEARFNYLMLPVQAKFGWNFSSTSPFRVYVSAGVFGSYLLSAERVSKGTFPPFYAAEKKGTLSDWAMANNPALGMMPEQAQQMILGGINQFANAQQKVNETTDVTSDVKRGNFGFIGCIGISWNVSDRHKIFIEGGGNYSMVKIQKDDLNGQNRIGAASVMMGYSFAF